MIQTPSAGWFTVFPSPRIPDVLSYISDTWNYLQTTFATAVSFAEDETALTDNLCEALEEPNRRRAANMGCDFQPETWELRRGADGKTTRVARADIRVIFGAPGTPHLVIEFKKLDGSPDSHWRYCFDGMNRFVEGKYAQGHAIGVMCGFTPNSLNTEAAALAAYIDKPAYQNRLCCIVDSTGTVIIRPSQTDPALAWFDTNHDRPYAGPGQSIILLHTLLQCPKPKLASATRVRRRKTK